MLGAAEILLIILIVLLVFGARRLPDLARGMGLAIRKFRTAIREEEEGDRKGSGGDHP